MSDNRAPKFKPGDIVRYGGGPTALIKIVSVKPNHPATGSHRYFGLHFYGGGEGRYEEQLETASEPDIKKWFTDNHLRRFEVDGILDKVTPTFDDQQACQEFWAMPADYRASMDRHSFVEGRKFQFYGGLPPKEIADGRRGYR